ncbi:MAG: ATP synthase F1 subunit epsilon [Blastocatellia bacterium]
MLKLEIVTPERRVLEAEVESVTVPTASGEAGILSNHAPLISALKPGVLTYFNKGVAEKMAVAGGFVEVSNNKVAVMTDSVKTADEVDIEAAKAMRDEAERELASLASGAIEEAESAREQLDTANAILQLTR